MHELTLLPVGGGPRSGDAITLRFTRPGTADEARVLIDAGYREDGPAVVAHVREAWGSDRIDLAVLTHPDPDHVGGLPHVLESLDVARLWVHRLDRRGGGRTAGGKAVRELVALAERRGTEVVEAWPGDAAFGGALRVVGPDEAAYERLADLQARGIRPRRGGPHVLAWREITQRVMAILPFELRFGAYEGTSPRNDSSLVLWLELPGLRALLPADAGVESIHRALDRLAPGSLPPDLVLLAHHGSRYNASSELLDRLLGRRGAAPAGRAFCSAAKGSPFHPANHVVAAYERRGWPVSVTAGRALRHTSA